MENNVVTIHNMPQRSDEWFEARLGRITGSIMKDYVKADGTLKSNSVIKKHISKKIAEIILNKPPMSSVDSSDMHRGRELEDVALALHYAVGYEDVGFVTNVNFKYFGHSPDSVLIEDSEMTKAVEVKCLNDANHIHAITEDVIPIEYKHQMGLLFVLSPSISTQVLLLFNPNFDGALERFIIPFNKSDNNKYLNNLRESMIKITEIIDEQLTTLNNVVYHV